MEFVQYLPEPPLDALICQGMGPGHAACLSHEFHEFAGVRTNAFNAVRGRYRNQLPHA